MPEGNPAQQGGRNEDHLTADFRVWLARRHCRRGDGDDLKHRLRQGLPVRSAQYRVAEKNGFKHTAWTNTCLAKVQGIKIIHKGAC